jgi:purine-binding chemotaxis protein CheW
MEALVAPVGDRDAAIALSAVRETLPLGAIAPLPGMPPVVLGAINVHGEVLVLLDTALLLGEPPLDAPTHAAVVLTARGPAALAATAQPVTAVLDDGAGIMSADELLDSGRSAAAGC